MTEAAKRRLRKGWPLALVLGVLMAAGLGAILLEPSTAQQPQPQSGPPLVPVSIARVTRQDVPIYLKGLGSVQAFNAVLVRARVDGTLTEFPVTEGQEVKQGDLIAVIDPRPYQAALDAAMAKKSQDDADFVNSKSDLARYTSLEQKSFASHQQVDTQQALVNHMTAAIAGDNAAIEMAKLNLSYCFITSPIQGRVGLRQVDPGNLVHASDAAGIVTITQIHPISALFTVPQDSLPTISVAMEKGKLPVIAFAADDKTQLDQGALLTPDNAIDASGAIHQRTPAAWDRAERADRAVRCSAARTGRSLRLRCGPGSVGGATAGGGRQRRRGTLRHRQGADRRSTGRD